MHILYREPIESVLPEIDLVAAMEDAFAAYSRGLAVVPPVGELTFDEPPGDAHIKYGYLRGGAYFVVKVATGFYANPTRGLPSSNGLMLLFRQDTGTPAAVLLDEGTLTDIRTAAAGAVCAKHLAPRAVHRIGILGTGIQARLQLAHLASVTECRNAVVWGRRRDQAEALARSARGFHVSVAFSPAEVAAECNLIVTTTPSSSPLLMASEVQAGTHITAVGSDTPTKQELDSEILRKADVVVADSVEQCRERGEIHHALEAGAIGVPDIRELGKILDGAAEGRTDDAQITVADLTGVAVQDLVIAERVFAALRQTNSEG